MVDRHGNALKPFDIGMMLLSLVAVVLVSVLLLVPLEDDVRNYLLTMDTFICLIFLAHFLFNWLTADSPLTYLKHHWIDLIASIPAVEPFRLARFLQVFRVIRLLRAAHYSLLPTFKARIQTTLATLMAVLIVVIGGAGLSIYLVEHNAPGAMIKTAEDALWWSLVTISTVGYGDFYPVTTTGRIIAVLLIMSGVSLFGVISGYLVSHFITPDEDDQLALQSKRLSRIDVQVEDLTHSVNRLHEKLDQLLADKARSSEDK
ncbi:hypothetical protein TK45_11895 [Bowmanella sp. JS7-9]|nr:hypothetical protein TK45_11895 [Bowmanella sp. JS7-9]